MLPELTALSHKEILSLDKDYEKTAETIDLIYVSDEKPGIARLKKGKGFSYLYNGKTIKEKKEIERYKKLAIPPAWMDVWICKEPNGHIQATGYDIKSRKQYRYHHKWNSLRNQTKFHRIHEFGKVLPKLRLQIEKDLSEKSLTVNKVIAAVTAIMERTYIRIGNHEYEKQNNSYGLTTLKDKHVDITGTNMKFSFRGKKGIYHDITLRNKKLASIVKECREIPGKELFQYYDENGERKQIDSGMVNRYIKDATGGDFTAKDFRTWAGTLAMIEAFSNMYEFDTDSDLKRNINLALDEVSQKLGNTRTVCRKYYVHPGVIKLYEEKKLSEYLKELDKIEVSDNFSDLTKDEKLMLKIFKDLN